MKYPYEDPKYKILVEILHACADHGSGYGIDVSDIDIEWLYDKLTELGANLDELTEFTALDGELMVRTGSYKCSICGEEHPVYNGEDLL